MSAGFSEMRKVNHTLLVLRRFAAITLMLAVSAMASATDGPAPDFSLPDKSGTTLSLSAFSGQVVLLNFWASWCGPCREEMPLLDALQQRYESLGFTMLGINVEEDSSAADRFLQSTPVSFPILYDRENSVSKLYDVIAMPSTVLIGRDGRVRYVHHGYEPGYENDYQNQIRELVKE
jgi:peroxiredoxin